MHPVLFEIGNFQIPSYGVSLVAAFLIATFLLKREAGRQGLNRQKTVDAALIGLLFGLLGAKLLLILVDLPEYVADPKLLLGTIRSAGVIYGGMIAGALGVVWYIRRHELPFWPTLDTMSPFLALAVGLGRLGCLSAGCCYGIDYEGPFALHFPDHPRCEAPPDIGLFPVQLLALVNGVALFFILRFLLRRRRFDGQVTAACFFLYSATRGAMEFLRGDHVRGMWFGNAVSTSQIIALLGLVVSAYLYFKKRKDGLA